MLTLSTPSCRSRRPRAKFSQSGTWVVPPTELRSGCAGAQPGGFAQGLLYEDSVKDRVRHVIRDLIGVQDPARHEPPRCPVGHASHRLGEHLRLQRALEDSLFYPVADYHVEQVLIASSRGDDLGVQ